MLKLKETLKIEVSYRSYELCQIPRRKVGNKIAEIPRCSFPLFGIRKDILSPQSRRCVPLY